MTLDTSIVRSASTFGPMQTDWETRIDMDRLRTQRLRKTREAMASAELDFMIELRMENARYSTGIKRLYWPTIQLGGGPLAVIAAAGDRVSVVWRPGDLVIEPSARPAGAPLADGALEGEVVDVRAGSSLTDYTIDVGPTKVRALRLGRALMPPGSRVTVSCPADRAVCISD